MGGALALLTAISSLLPDLDADGSRPTRYLWQGAAFVGAIATGMLLWNRNEPPTALLGALLVGVLIRYGLSAVMMRFLRHRGWFHSLQVAWLWASLAVIGFSNFIEPLAVRSRGWVFLGAFVGYIVHLLLDEIYSVDLNNARIRRSFGSALKLWDPQRPLAGVVLSFLGLWTVWRFAALWQVIWREGLWAQ